MSNLRDQLQKAKLLSKKDAKRLAHEERVERSAVGREGVEQEKQRRQAELQALTEQQRRERKATQAELDAARQAAAERAACAQILAEQVQRPGPHGRTKWYFEGDHGYLPFLEVGDIELKQILSGGLAVVRIGSDHGHDYGLLPAGLAGRVAAVYSARVVWWPGKSGRSAPPHA